MEALIHNIEAIITFVGILFDIAGVLVIVVGFVIATLRWFATSRTADDAGIRLYRIELGRTLLLSLEILVAADIIRTVAVELSLENLLALGLLVLIRTFLSWSLELEVDGRFPWQRRSETLVEGTTTK